MRGKKKKDEELQRINRRLTKTGASALGQPARKTVWMEYYANYPMGSAGTSTFGEPLITNAPFSPDPGSVSLTTPTFTFNANGFSLYRCDKTLITWEVLNRETFGVQAMLLVRDTTTGATVGGGVYANVQEYASQGYTKVGFVSGTTGTPKLTLRALSIVDRVVGERTEQDNLYRSLTNSIPSNLTWIIIGCQSDSVFVNGVSSYLRMRMRVHFFGFIGIAVTMEEMMMCAGCRQQNLWIDKGIISYCCDAKRECNNCGAIIPCCRGEGVIPNPSCKKILEQRDPRRGEKILLGPKQLLKRSKSMAVLVEKPEKNLDNQAGDLILPRGYAHPFPSPIPHPLGGEEPEFEVLTPSQKKLQAEWLLKMPR